MSRICAIRGLLRQPAHVSILTEGHEGLAALDSRKSESLLSWTKTPWHSSKLNPHTSLNTLWHVCHLVVFLCLSGLHNQEFVFRSTKTMNARTSAPPRLEEQIYFIFCLFDLPRCISPSCFIISTLQTNSPTMQRGFIIAFAMDISQ